MTCGYLQIMFALERVKFHNIANRKEFVCRLVLRLRSIQIIMFSSRYIMDDSKICVGNYFWELVQAPKGCQFCKGEYQVMRTKCKEHCITENHYFRTYSIYFNTVMYLHIMELSKMVNKYRELFRNNIKVHSYKTRSSKEVHIFIIETDSTILMCAVLQYQYIQNKSPIN